MKIFSIIYVCVITVLMVDILGAVMWILSGQVPMDNFYIGTITIHLLKLIF